MAFLSFVLTLIFFENLSFSWTWWIFLRSLSIISGQAAVSPLIRRWSRKVFEPTLPSSSRGLDQSSMTTPNSGTKSAIPLSHLLAAKTVLGTIKKYYFQLSQFLRQYFCFNNTPPQKKSFTCPFQKTWRNLSTQMFNLNLFKNKSYYMNFKHKNRSCMLLWLIWLSSVFLISIFWRLPSGTLWWWIRGAGSEPSKTTFVWSTTWPSVSRSTRTRWTKQRRDDPRRKVQCLLHKNLINTEIEINVRPHPPSCTFFLIIF